MTNKIRDAISKRLREISAAQFIQDPEKYIGPNWETVINFWVFHDNLSRKQYEEVNRRYSEQGYSSFSSSKIITYSEPFISTQLSFRYCSEGYATREIIAFDELLNDGEEIKFLKIYEDL